MKLCLYVKRWTMIYMYRSVYEYDKGNHIDALM